MKTIRNSKKFRIYKAARREMTARFPAAFPRSGSRPPLKMGILADIRGQGTELSMTDCRLFLRIWTRSTAYLKNMSRDAQRVGLDGAAHGGVTVDHAREAKAALKSRRLRKEALTAI